MIENPAARSGIERILSKLPPESLFSLAATVTQGLLMSKLKTPQEAIEAIINFSPDAVSVLKRQKVTREVLLDYVHDSRISVSLPVTKHELVQKIRDHWNGGNFIQKPEPETSSSNMQGTIDLLAEQYSEWFYSLLNNPEPIGVEHFFLDARLSMQVSQDGQIIEQSTAEDPSSAATLLFAIKSMHNLHFNPNLTPVGFKGVIEPHGLVSLAVCGTLHRGDDCVGVFEQAFSIARDPAAENNWKIKCTELNLKCRDAIVTPPAITDCEYFDECTAKK